ncbi:MAG: gliding motility lipoprotein GldD [Bacteroidota bacterium]
MTRDRQRFRAVVWAPLLLMLLHACTPDYTPKPLGYLRIDLPEHRFQRLDRTCPFSFEYSDHATILTNPRHRNNPCWFDIVYPRFRAAVHLTYAPLEDNLHEHIEDVHSLAMKHIAKADDIDDRIVYRDTASVYGITYDFEGSTASNYQFFLTDSTDHFVRGALYFNFAPNPDSIAPVMAFVKEDLQHLIRTFRWQASAPDAATRL